MQPERVARAGRTPNLGVYAALEVVTAAQRVRSGRRALNSHFNSRDPESGPGLRRYPGTVSPARRRGAGGTSGYRGARKTSGCGLRLSPRGAIDVVVFAV